jgi:hypothetical protein
MSHKFAAHLSSSAGVMPIVPGTRLCRLVVQLLRLNALLELLISLLLRSLQLLILCRTGAVIRPAFTPLEVMLRAFSHAHVRVLFCHAQAHMPS